MMSTKLMVVVENLDSMLDSLEEKLVHDPKPDDNKNLDSMLETLEERLSLDGIPTTYKGMCASCEKSIHGDVCNALGQTFHPGHFRCTVCDSDLYTTTFYERDGKAFCETDYHEKYAPKCFWCKKAVIGACITLGDHTWHPDHFVCEKCNKPIGDDIFYEKNGKAYCDADYKRLFTPKCPGCDEYVLGLIVNKQWHQQCFVCGDCKRPLEGINFYEYDGKPFCEIHFRAKRKSVCHGCNQLILHRCLTANGKKYHPEHFTCYLCAQELNEDYYKETKGKPYCKKCHLKVFGKH